MPPQAILLRIFPWGDSGVHGGVLRSEQIAALVGRALPAARLVTATYPKSLPRAEFAAITAAGVLRMGTGLSPREAFFQARVERILDTERLRAGDIVIYDADPRYGPPLARACRQRGLVLVALPHNVEALIPQGWPIAIDAVASARLLAREVGWLAAATQVWTIGAFDRDLFQLFDITARQLPYAPPPARHAELAALREGRDPRHILILGTAHNPPTRAGMLEQLRLAETLPPGLPVMLAGYGTDNLAPDAGPRVRCLGPLPWDEVKALLAGASAVWVHQAPMTGALTRIPEALVAGVPVVANGWAARGHGALPGMTVYDDAAGLAAALAAAPAAAPMPDITAAEDAFVTALRSLA